MDRIEIALREYQRIAPPPRLGANASKSDALEDWLRERVVPVVEDLMRTSARFRRLATWSLKHLAPGSQTPERAAVVAVEKALVACATTIVSVVAEAALLAVPVDPKIQDGPAPASSPRHRAPTELERAAVEQTAKCPWMDLVSPRDFLLPLAGLNLRESNADLSIAFQKVDRKGLVLSDQIVRMLFERIDFWRRAIEAAWQWCNNELMKDGKSNYNRLERLFTAKIGLDQAVDDLRRRCHSGEEARLRDASCALLQAYAAHHRSPQLDWLDLPRDYVEVEGAVVRNCMRPVGEQITVEPAGGGKFREVGRTRERLMDMAILQQVAAALDDVVTIYRQSADPEDMIREAVEKHALVVVENPRMVFWKGKKLDIDWLAHGGPSEFLLHLAAQAKKMQGLDRYSLGKELSNRELSVRKHALCKLLKEHTLNDLAGKIKKVKGGPCTLDLKPSEIEVLDPGGDAWTINTEEPDLLEALGATSGDE